MQARARMTSNYNAYLNRFSSRLHRLSHVYLKSKLQGATSYCRIAGYTLSGDSLYLLKGLKA
jgi:uncharacterized protein (UPF0297 family)